jgi:hypothetical protein
MQRPLLIAIDFNSQSESFIKIVDNVSANEAGAYLKGLSPEAANRDRTGFNSASNMYLIEKIEVG